MFFKKKKRKEDPLFYDVNDNRTTPQEFKLRSETFFSDYRPIDYGLYAKLEENNMTERLEKHLERLFRGEVDDANGDALDNIIFGTIREATAALRLQHTRHETTIRSLIARREADKKDLMQIIQELEAELSDLQSRHEKTLAAQAKLGDPL